MKRRRLQDSRGFLAALGRFKADLPEMHFICADYLYTPELLAGRHVLAARWIPGRGLIGQGSPREFVADMLTVRPASCTMLNSKATVEETAFELDRLGMGYRVIEGVTTATGRHEEANLCGCLLHFFVESPPPV